MKLSTFNFQLSTLLLLLFGSLCGFAATAPYVPATQAEVNAGVNTWKGVTPATLRSYAGGPTNGLTALQTTNIANSVASSVASSVAGSMVTNLAVRFTITTNLSYTNWLTSAGASNIVFNGTWTWNTDRYTKDDSSVRWISNTAAGIVMRTTGPSLAFTNDSYTGLYKTNQNQSTPPWVFYSTNPIITTNWFIAGASYQLPLAKVDFEDFGAKGDGVKLYAATVVSGNLICTNAAFGSNDVGKWAFIYSTPTNTEYTACRIVAFNNPTNVSLSTNFTQSTAYEAWYGTGNQVAVSNAISSFRGDGVVNFTGQYGDNYLFEQSVLDATSLRYAVINIPTDRSTGIITNTSRTIVIRGRTPAIVYPAFIVGGGTTNTLGTPNVGTTLLNFAKPVANATNVFVYHDGTGAGGSQFARERVFWENLTLRQPGKPTHHGMYLARSGTTYLKRLNVDVDQSANWLNYTSGLPPFFMEGIVSNANSIFGIYGPDPYNYAGVQLEDVTVAYHGTAYRLGEHTVGVGKTIGIASGALLYADGAFGSQGTYSGATFDFLYPYLCQYRIVIATNSTAREPLTVQNLLVEEGFPRADIGPLVYDPLKRGDINIQAITGNAQNTTIESTNGSWNNTILNFSYDRGVIHSNGVVYGSGAGLTSLNASALASGTVPNEALTNRTLVGQTNQSVTVFQSGVTNGQTVINSNKLELIGAGSTLTIPSAGSLLFGPGGSSATISIASDAINCNADLRTSSVWPGSDAARTVGTTANRYLGVYSFATYYPSNTLTLAQASAGITNGGHAFVTMSNSFWLLKMTNNVLYTTNLGIAFFP